MSDWTEYLIHADRFTCGMSFVFILCAFKPYLKIYLTDFVPEEELYLGDLFWTYYEQTSNTSGFKKLLIAWIFTLIRLLGVFFLFLHSSCLKVDFSW